MAHPDKPPDSNEPRWLFRRRETGLWIPQGLSVGGLFMPEAMEKVERINTPHPVLQYFHITVGFEELFGNKSTFEGVCNRLRQYTLEEVVAVISRITIVLFHRGLNDKLHEAQLRIAFGLFGHDKANAIFQSISKMKDGRGDWKSRALFHERQTLNLLKVALLTLPSSGSSTAESDLSSLGEALLMMNDLIERGPWLDSENLGHDNEFELYVFANVFFNEGISELSDFARSYELFIRDHPGLPEYVNLRERLNKTTGLAPERFLFSLQALHGVYYAIKPDEVHTKPVAISLSKSFGDHFNILPKEIDQILSLACLSASELKRRIGANYTLENLRPFDFKTLVHHPLVSFEDRVYCMSLPLLRDLSGRNLQNRFLDQDMFNEQERNRFLGFRGRLYEDYAQQLLRRSFDNRFIDGNTLKKAASGCKICDGAVLYPDVILLIEIKSALVPLRAKVAESFEAYNKKKNEAFYESAEQLDSTIKLCEAGKYIQHGIDPKRIREYIPLTITMEFLIESLSYPQILENIKSKGLLIGPKVASMQILDTHELEMLETAITNGRCVLDLFQEKISKVETQAMSFKNYCHHKQENWFNKHNPYLEVRYKEMADIVISVAKRLARQQPQGEAPSV